MNINILLCSSFAFSVNRQIACQWKFVVLWLLRILSDTHVSLSFSMFVLLKGATKEQAFKIGNEIAEAVTATNPKPVKLKFEKVCEVVWICGLSTSILLYPCSFKPRDCCIPILSVCILVCLGRCTSHACYRLRSVMLDTCMRAWIRKTQSLTPKALKLYVVMAALLLPRYLAFQNYS